MSNCHPGADVSHPAPGTQGIPSHVGVVSSVDQTTAKYIPASGNQTGRQEIIADLEAMVIVCHLASFLNLADLMVT